MGADGHVRIEISGDSKPLEKDLQRAEKACSDALSEIGKESQKTEKALEDMGEAAKDACDSKVTGGLEDVADALADIGDSAGDAGKGVEDTGEKAESVWKKLEGMSDSAVELQEALSNTVQKGVATIGKTLAAVGAGVTAAFTATAGALTNLGNGYNKAVNQIGSATGVTGEELKELGQIAQNVYSHNFGDSLEDVADGIAVVRQNSQLMGEELEQAVEAGFALRDTFGYDIAESSRTASALMKNFSIDAEKAYNIIAVGAQNGADQNGDLLDTLNEYSTQYAALGLSADQFIGSLISGAEAGVFSIDKVGDAVKEFNIRAKDGSKSTISAFSTLKLDAAKTMEAFAQGGDTAQTAFFQVVKALEAMKDPVQKNQTAVALFGTQYEDLEKTVLPVMASMEDASEKTYDALGEINEIKYKDLGSALQGLKRTIEGALIPAASEIASGPMMDAMAELQKMANDLANSIKAGDFDSVFEGIADGITGVVKALPKIRDGIQKIIPVVTNIVRVGTSFLSAAVDNIDLVIAAIAGIGTAIAALKLLTFIGDVIKAVQALGAAFTISTGPIGLAVLAISGLAAAIAQYVVTSDDAEQAAYDSMETTKALREESEKLTEEYEQNREARLKAVEAAETETATAEVYAKKLETLAGKEHKSADEKRQMAYYVGKLNELLPDLNLQYDKEKDRLNESTDAIWDNIEAVKERARVKAYESNYTAAIEDQVKLEKTLEEAQAEYTKNLNLQKDAQKQLDETIQKSGEGYLTYRRRLAAAQDKLDEATEATNESKAALDDVQKSYEAAGQEAEDFAKKMEESAAEIAATDSLEKLAVAAEEASIEIPKSVAEGMESGKYQVAQSVEELQRLISFDEAIQNAGLQGVEIPQSLSESVNSGKVSVAEAVNRINGIAQFDMMASAAGVSGAKTTEALRNAIANGEMSIAEACAKLEKASVKALEPNGQAEKPGEMTSEEYAQGMLRRKSNATKATKEVTNASVKEAEKGTSKFEAVGKSLMSGLAFGIAKGTASAVAQTAASIEQVVIAAKKKADVNSPSKVMRDQVGLPLAEGLAVGMRKGAGQATAAAADMVDSAMDAAKTKLNTSELTLSPMEAKAAIAANIDSMAAQAKLAVQNEMERRAANVAAQTAAIPVYNDSQVIELLHQLVTETKAGKVLKVNQRELGRTVRQWEQKMSRVTGGE